MRSRQRSNDMSDLNSSDIVRVETTCELCGKQGDLAHGIFVCGPCCETGEEKRLRARIRELEAQLKTARQEALAFGKEVYFGHNCADRLGARPPCECELCAKYRALSRNEAQAKGGAHGE